MRVVGRIDRDQVKRRLHSVTRDPEATPVSLTLKISLAGTRKPLGVPHENYEFDEVRRVVAELAAVLDRKCRTAVTGNFEVTVERSQEHQVVFSRKVTNTPAEGAAIDTNQRARAMSSAIENGSPNDCFIACYLTEKYSESLLFARRFVSFNGGANENFGYLCRQLNPVNVLVSHKTGACDKHKRVVQFV